MVGFGRLYCDTSFLLKLILDEADSAAARAWLSLNHSVTELVASDWAKTELACALDRIGLGRSYLAAATDQMMSARLASDDVLTPQRTHWGLRGAGALHLAIALRLQCQGLVTYDRELAQAGAELGLEIIAPTGVD